MAFLLPHYHYPRIFLSPLSVDHLLFKAALIFGFFGMFRFSTFHKLGAPTTVLVDVAGREFALTKQNYALLQSPAIRGFYFSFSSKCHPHARAYYCTLEHLQHPWKTICPLTALRQMGKNGLLFTGQLFPKEKLTSTALGSFMSFVARTRHAFTPHSLRIGGHTFFSAQNMHEDFVQFLGRRAIKKSSQLYYRAQAGDNILRLEMFFARLSRSTVVNENGLFDRK